MFLLKGLWSQEILIHLNCFHLMFVSFCKYMKLGASDPRLLQTGQITLCFVFLSDGADQNSFLFLIGGGCAPSLLTSDETCNLFCIHVSFNLYPFLYLCKFVWSFGLSYFCLTYYHYLFVNCHLFTWINYLFYSSMVLHFVYMEVIGFRQVVRLIWYP